MKVTKFINHILLGVALMVASAEDTYKIDSGSPTKGYRNLGFDLTQERMTPILQAGEAAMETHLDKRFLK
jgi:hypothetical protein